MPQGYFAKLMFVLITAAVGLFSLQFSFFKKSRFAVNISHKVGSQMLKLDSVTYYNSFSQPFSITKLKYYLGQIHLVSTNESKTKSSDYFLVDAEKPGSSLLDIGEINAATYTGIEFLVGVDSLNNCKGIQSGALDPVHAMFWAWNTGYIFFKLEGIAPNCSTPLHLFEFHIGGYKLPTNCIRKIRINFNKPLVVKADGRSILNLEVDLLKVLDGKNKINFLSLCSVTDSHHASELADNYSQMFSVEQ